MQNVPAEPKAPYTLGSLWMLVAGVLFASMGVFVQLGTQYFSSHEMVFYIYLIVMVLIAVAIQRNGWGVYSSNWEPAWRIVFCFSLVSTVAQASLRRSMDFRIRFSGLSHTVGHRHQCHPGAALHDPGPTRGRHADCQQPGL